MISPHPYIAAAAASVLVALYFVPSASASPSDDTAQTVSHARTAGQTRSVGPTRSVGRTRATVGQTRTVEQAAATRSTGGGRVSAADSLTTDIGSGGLADTGAMNTKPYLLGGTVFLLAGAGLVVNAGRRSRRELAEDEDEDA